MVVKPALPPIDPNHEAKRRTLQRVGLGLLALGVPCAVLGAGLFISTSWRVPSGGAIVLALSVLFFVSLPLGRLRRR